MSHAFLNTAQSLAANLPKQISQEIRVQSHTVQVKERLAAGGFGFVDLVCDIHSKSEYVLKRCNVSTKESLDIVQKEIKILQTFEGPYIVRIIASDMMAVKTGSSGGVEAFILLEYCPGGHMLDRLRNRNGSLLPASSIYRIFGQLLLAMKSLHEHDPIVVHRDLKLENILFGPDGNVRLCDFGSCVYGHTPLRNATERTSAEDVIEKTTTQMYRSPEMVDLYQRDFLTEKTDIWALGCIFYALIYLLHPFQDAGSLGILSGKINYPANYTVSEDAQIVLKRLLDMDPEARPSATECFQALSAIATGNPLPPYELSAEAIERRKQREAAAIKKEQKVAAKRHVPALVPQRSAPAQLDTNSVAARRLAAKKGIVIPPTNVSAPSKPPVQITTIPTQSSSDESFANFADFADFTPNPISATKPPKPIATAENLFDFTGPVDRNTSQLTNEFDFDPFPSNASTQPAEVKSADIFFEDIFQTDMNMIPETSIETIESRLEKSAIMSSDQDNRNPQYFDAFETSFGSAVNTVSEGKQASNPTQSNQYSNVVGFDDFFNTINAQTSSGRSITADWPPIASFDDIRSQPSAKPVIEMATPVKSNRPIDLLNDDSSSGFVSSKDTLTPTKSSMFDFDMTPRKANEAPQMVRYGSSSASVLQMFDSPAMPPPKPLKPSGAYNHTTPMKGLPMNQISSSSPYQPASHPQTMMSPNQSIIMTTNPAFGRTGSIDFYSDKSSFSNIPNQYASPAMAAPVLNRSNSNSTGIPFRGLNAGQSKQKDPFDTLTVLNK